MACSKALKTPTIYIINYTELQKTESCMSKAKTLQLPSKVCLHHVALL